MRQLWEGISKDYLVNCFVVRLHKYKALFGRHTCNCADVVHVGTSVVNLHALILLTIVSLLECPGCEDYLVKVDDGHLIVDCLL